MCRFGQRVYRFVMISVGTGAAVYFTRYGVMN
jgi:hypothetical protein